MGQLIPNENSFVGVILAAANKPYGLTATNAPTLAEINTALDLTDYLISLNFSASGNSVPTPRLRSLFETSVPGTATATATADFYRDDEDDLAWDSLPRNQKATFIVQRFGGTGTDGRPAATQETEVWSIHVISRAGSALQSGTAQTFTMTGSVPVEPDEAYVVPAA